MYVTINNIIGKKTINLAYPIRSGESKGPHSVGVAVIRMLSDNIQYNIIKPRTIMDPISDNKKLIPSGTYAGRELLSVLEGIVKLSSKNDGQVIKINKLKGITEMILNLNLIILIILMMGDLATSYSLIT